MPRRKKTTQVKEAVQDLNKEIEALKTQIKESLEMKSLAKNKTMKKNHLRINI